MSISAWNDARVGAVLIDRKGRRTGWNVDRPIDEIPGCVYGSGSDEGIPEEWWLPEDTTEVALPETVGIDTAFVRVPAPQPTPKFHEFDIFNDIVTPVGLIDQGGCELRLDPVVGGKVQLTLSATGVGFNMCKDTTSVWVRPGAPSRWRLSWKAAGDKCTVKISRIAGKRSSSSSR
ncbi:MAG: hypothetical protein HZC42_00810 [Candidatus Eisenbacteria bacterium]|nr:hypothetical protein [Candidatus Eisenbacteria bacterium]